MRILELSQSLFGKTLSKGSIFSVLGIMVASKLLENSRKKWEVAREKSEETLLAQMSAYDMGKGAGKLMKGWLLFNQPDLTVQQAEAKLQTLLKAMDREDHLPDEQARSRFLVSKTLFFIEGFKLSRCQYEQYQKAAWELSRKNPARQKLTRNDTFHGKPFLPEDLIAITHRALLIMDNGKLARYIHQVINKPTLKDDADHMAYLIALTLNAEPNTLGAAINTWFASYCDFKIDQSHQREAMVNTSITTVTGGLPASIGMDLLGKAGKRWFNQIKAPKKPKSTV
ncbi:hypothetical protein [Vampirovibrio sp.]|uniref:hypothetical protein n=1 Tax=Vampirovibrio sp. TaxID=2717857 RepID=UPI0035935ECF